MIMTMFLSEFINCIVSYNEIIVRPILITEMKRATTMNKLS
jgi:hypothetical protein